MRNTIANRAVSSVATQGQSVGSDAPNTAASRPSSDKLGQRARGAGQAAAGVPWNMLNIMNQMAAALPKLPNSGANVGPRRHGEVAVPSGSGPRMPSQTRAGR